MFNTALILFAIAALGGLTMAVMHFRGKTPPPLALAVLHGILAACGLVILLLAVMKIGMGGAPGIALGLFLVAALGGFTLLSFHLRGRALPNGLVIGHGLLAVAGFLVLLTAVFATA
ncbi:MAG TPA: hypothetical protein VKB34_04895 [Povalibacter sp.]|nr:hypothetical protein [Povalibacter sp.]